MKGFNEADFCANCGKELSAVRYYTGGRAFCDEHCKAVYEEDNCSQRTPPPPKEDYRQIEFNLGNE